MFRNPEWLTPIYVVGAVLTWVFLMMEDYDRMSFLAWITLADAINAFLAVIWPVYWVVLRWIH